MTKDRQENEHRRTTIIRKWCPKEMRQIFPILLSSQAEPPLPFLFRTISRANNRRKKFDLENSSSLTSSVMKYDYFRLRLYVSTWITTCLWMMAPFSGRKMFSTHDCLKLLSETSYFFTQRESQWIISFFGFIHTVIV